MNAGLRLALTLGLDAGYLMAFLVVLHQPWLSYVLLIGLVVGALAARNWWWQPLRGVWQVAMLAGSLLVPFTAWTLSRVGLACAPAESPVPAWGIAHGLRPRLGMMLLLGGVLVACASGFAERRVLGPVLAPAEVSAVTTLNRSLGLAAASYGSARLIDRGIALVSEAELTLPFIGGVAVKPGQVFKPLQDMAERYSDVMVVAMASIGIQRVLLELGHTGAVTVLGSALALLLMVALIIPAAAWRLVALARSMLVLLIVARVAIPLTVMAVGSISEAVLEERRQQAQQALDMATTELQAADIDALEDDSSGLMAWLNDLQNQTTEMALSVRQFSDDMVDRFIQLLVVYLLETLFLPLAMLFALWRILRTLAVPAPALASTAARLPAEQQRLGQR